MAQLYEVTLFQSYFGQQVVNRWNYWLADPVLSGDYMSALTAALGFVPDAAGAFIPNTLASAIQGVVSTSLSFRSVLTRRIYSETGIYELPFPAGVNGGASGDPASPTLAFGFTSNRVRTTVRRGQKRLAGVSEVGVSAGGVITAEYLAVLNDVALEMSADVEVAYAPPLTATFSPCICSLQVTTNPVTGGVSRDYYPTIELQAEHTAVGVTWSVKPEVRTQTSRQYGRGV